MGVSAIWHGYKNYKENVRIGYNKIYYEQTGQKIEFHGGIKEAIPCTFAASVSLLFSLGFLAIETLKFIPAAFVLYLIS